MHPERAPIGEGVQRLAPVPAPAAPSLRDAIARRGIAELLEGRPGTGKAGRPPAPAADAIGTPAAGAGLDPLLDMMVADALLDAGISRDHPRIARSVRGTMRRYPAAEDGRPRPITTLGDPPDALAALAQALLLLARLGRRDLIAAHCTPPLAILLAYAEADGAIPAWALPEQAPPDAVAAIAALVYGLARWDARRFLGMIVAGARWVGDRQRPDGSWAASADAEGLYCSWQALRLLGAVMPNHPAVARAADHLHGQRHEDGGWGAAGLDPLASALAILALTAARTERHPAPTTQLRLLLAPGPGGWPARPFPFPGRSATGGAPAAQAGTSLVTAMFALKASEALQAEPRQG